MEHKLGELSAKYESGPKGSAAIGWDSTGGTSYGKYQIASKVGTFAKFVEWCMKQPRYGMDVGTRLAAAKPFDTGSTKGKCPDVWKVLVQENKLQELEHQFIEATQFHVSLAKLSDELRSLILSNWVLSDVYWSTVVQHGVGGARTVFNTAWDTITTRTIEELIRAVYKERSTKFKSSTPAVQENVKARFKDERDKALTALTTDKY